MATKFEILSRLISGKYHIAKFASGLGFCMTHGGGFYGSVNRTQLDMLVKEGLLYHPEFSEKEKLIGFTDDNLYSVTGLGYVVYGLFMMGTPKGKFEEIMKVVGS